MPVLIKYLFYKFCVNLEIACAHFPYYLFYYHIDHLDLETSVFLILALVQELYDRIGHTRVVSKLDQSFKYFRLFLEKLEQLLRLNTDDCIQYFHHVIETILVWLFLLDIR
jgi:hypothetical protein